MAKKRMTAARKRAFKKMLAGLKRYRRAKGGARSRSPRRRPRAHARRRVGSRRTRSVYMNPIRALLANPSVGYSPAYSAGYASAFGPKKRKTKKRRSSGMAKRRRKSRKSKSRRRVATPKRRVHRRRRTHARRRKGSPFAARVRRGTRVIYLNPRHKRRRRRNGRARRRNPGFMGAIKSTFVPYAVGFVTSVAASFIDSKLSSMPIVRDLSKVVASVGIAIVGRRHPIASAAAIGSLAGSTGYALGTKLLGGMVAHDTAGAVKGLAEMSRVNPGIGALLNGGIGALLNGPTNVPQGVSDYEHALRNMSGSDDDD